MHTFSITLYINLLVHADYTQIHRPFVMYIGRSPRLFDAENTKAAAATTDTNSTSVDESKIHLVFCIELLRNTEKGLILVLLLWSEDAGAVLRHRAWMPGKLPFLQSQVPAAVTSRSWFSGDGKPSLPKCKCHRQGILNELAREVLPSFRRFCPNRVLLSCVIIYVGSMNYDWRWKLFGWSGSHYLNIVH